MKLMKVSSKLQKQQMQNKNEFRHTRNPFKKIELKNQRSHASSFSSNFPYCRYIFQ